MKWKWIVRILLLGVMCLFGIAPVRQFCILDHLNGIGWVCLVIAVVLFLIVGADWAIDESPDDSLGEVPAEVQ